MKIKLMFVMLLLVAQFAMADVVVNEVLSNGEEFVELYNNGEEEIDLTDWTIEDNNAEPEPLAGTIASGAYLLLTQGEDFDFELNNAGDIVTVKDADGATESTVTYGNHDDGDVDDNADAPGADETIGRIPDGDSDAEFVVFEEGRTTLGAVNNRAPAGSLPAQSMTQGVTGTLELDLTELITDADTDELSFRVTDEDDDDGVDCEIVGDDDSTLEMTLGDNWDQRVNTCTIEADDSFEQTDFDVTINVKPALEIIHDTITISKNGAAGEAYQEDFNVSPGDDITVSFDYRNNLLNGLRIGNIEITAEADWNPDFVDHSARDFSLLGLFEDATFTFTIPQDVNDNFEVELKLVDDAEDGNSYQDEFELEFELVRESRSIHLESASLADYDLTCTTITDLTLELTNNGENDVAPRILVYTRDPTGDVNEDGNFDFVVAEDAKGVAVLEADYAATDNNDDNNVIDDGETVEITVPFDSADYELNNNLYVVVVDPFFGDDGIGAEVVVPFTTDACLNVPEIREALQIDRESGESPEIDLSEMLEDENIVDGETRFLFLTETFPSAEEIEDDQAVDYEFEFSLPAMVDEDDEPLDLNLDCSIVDDTMLSCEQAEGKESFSGTEGHDLTITETTTGSVFTETFQITVNPTLEISNVQAPAKVQPGQEIDISFTASNDLDNTITQIQATLEDADGSDDFDFVAEDRFNVASGRSVTKILTGTVGLDAGAAKYLVVLTLTGTTVDGDEVSDSYEFQIEVEREDAEITLTAELADEEQAALTCSEGVELDLSYTNTGNNDETDIVILVTDNGEILYDSAEEVGGFLAVPLGETRSSDAFANPVAVPVRGQGVHALEVEVLYNFAGDVAAADERGPAASTSNTVRIPVTKGGCLNTETFQPDAAPVEDPLVVGFAGGVDFSVELHEEGTEDFIEWSVKKVRDDKEQPVEEEAVVQAQGPEFQFVGGNEEATFKITAIYNSDPEESISSHVAVTEGLFTREFAVVLPEDADLENVPNFAIQNDLGSITFKDNVNLLGILDLDDWFIIEQGFVSVDNSDEFGGRFPGEATITLKNIPQGKTVIYKYDAFNLLENLEDPTICTVELGCQATSHASNGDFTFKVNSFSSYQVVIEKEVALQAPGSIDLTDAERGQVVNTTFKLKNLGTVESLTGINFDLSSINAKYNAQLTDAPVAIEPDTEVTIGLQLTIPTDEDAGRHTIGSIKVNSAEVAQKSIPVVVSPKTFLTIESIKINGKTSGDLELDSTNDIKVRVQNDYTEDMENVRVTVRILDVDGDDLEEDSEDFDLRDGRDKDVTLEFDLRSEKIDEEEYTVEIIAEADADDGSTHEALETLTVDVDIPRHSIVIKDAGASASTLQCLKQTSIDVNIENLGRSNEDDVEIRVKNTALGLDERKGNIDLDKLTGSDNDYRTTFSVNAENANPGTYPITVEVLRDGNLEDSESIPITVQECVTASRSSAGQNVRAQPADANVAQQLEDQLRARQAALTEQQNVVTGSFRDSSTYTTLLGVLIVLVLIAVVLAFAVLLVKKPGQ